MTLLLLADQPDGAARAAWCGLHPDMPATRRGYLLGQADALDAGARQLGFERLLVRCAALPAAQHAQLREDADAVWRADGRLSSSEAWRRLLLHHLLAPRRESVLRETHAASLHECAGAIAALSPLFAAGASAGVGNGDRGGGPDPAAWTAHVLAELGLAAQGQGGGVPATARAFAAHVRRLRDLGAMSRPRLLKTWCTRLAADYPHAPQAVWNQLRCACLLIDTPMPPELAARFPAQPAAGRDT